MSLSIHQCEWVCVRIMECQNVANEKQGQRRGGLHATGKQKNGEITSQNDEGEY